jgi:thioredoxin-related protein
VVLILSFGKASAKDFDDAVSQHIEYPAWFENTPFNDLEAVLDDARSQGKKGLMVLFTTEGCSYCEQFIRRSLGDQRTASHVQANFAAVGLEIFDDREMTDPRGEAMPIKAFAEREGAEFSPTLLFYGEDGERLVRQVGYQSRKRFRRTLDYLTDGHAEKESLSAYLRRMDESGTTASANAVLNDDPMFMSPPYALDRSRFPAEQPLLVIFEKAGCKACDDFHADVLALEEVRKHLQKFEIVRLDVSNAEMAVVTPDGHRTTAAEWYGQSTFSRLPALVFFDENGNQVLETDALVGRMRMLNSVQFVLQRAYEKGWTYQRFARTSAIERLNRERE